MTQYENNVSYHISGFGTFGPKEKKGGSKRSETGDSLAVRWLGPRASTAGGTGSTSGQETRTLHPLGAAKKTDRCGHKRSEREKGREKL